MEPVTRKKLIEVALPLNAINAAFGARKVHQAWAPQHPALVVGASSARSSASRALCPDGG